MMDCDTTGVEPDIALVKYKQLAGGGMLKILNRSVSLGLRRLWDTHQSQIEEIEKFISEKDTIEGAPHLKDEHLPVFDCAFTPANGTRSIRWQAHVEMMAAAQPFLSGRDQQDGQHANRQHGRRYRSKLTSGAGN